MIWTLCLVILLNQELCLSNPTPSTLNSTLSNVVEEVETTAPSMETTVSSLELLTSFPNVTASSLIPSETTQQLMTRLLQQPRSCDCYHSDQIFAPNVTESSSPPTSEEAPQQLMSQQRQQHVPTCDYIFSDKTFILRSENYSSGGVYPTNLDCSYFVQKNTSKVCYLELSFIRFDVEASAQCQFDYLEINNVRLCGSLARETTRTYIFEGNEKEVKFHSDGSTSRTGFIIKVDQLECEGDVIIRPKPLLDYVPTHSFKHDPPTSSYNASRDRNSLQSPYSTKGQESPSISVSLGQSTPSSSLSCNQFFMGRLFEIRSPGFPRSYPSNSECIYYIKKQSSSVCRLEVIYEIFSMEESNKSVCKRDFLDFNGVRMCGSLPSGEVRHYFFPDNEFRVRFVSDGENSPKHHSFKLSVKQLDCDINSIGSTNVKTSLDSDYNQFNDSLPPVSVLRDLSSPNPLQILTPINCDRSFSDVTFDIKSPNYPSSYDRNSRCKFTVIKARGKHNAICQLEVHFLDFELPVTSSETDCSSSTDYLTFDGFGRICNSIPSETVKFFPFDSRTFVITFSSEGSPVSSPNHFRGFHMKIRQRECQDPEVKQSFAKETPVTRDYGVKGTSMDQLQTQTPGPTSTQCGQMISDMEFEVRSPYYPSSYHDNVECVYTIRKNNPSICLVDLRFVDFDVEGAIHCSKDYLLMDGKKFCGRYKPNTFMTMDFSSINEKILYFKSDQETSRRGFFVTGKQRECSPPTQVSREAAMHPSPPSTGPSYPPSGLYSYTHSVIDKVNDSLAAVNPPSVCEYCLSQKTGVISSYNYPGIYPVNLDCKYKFTPLPGHCSVLVSFHDFSLETRARVSESSCLGTDYLEIDGLRYCFDQLRGQKRMFSFAREPVIRFITNEISARQGPGFRASYMQMPCEAPSVSSSSSSSSLSSLAASASNSSSLSYSSKSIIPNSESTVTSGDRISVLESGQKPAEIPEANVSHHVPRVPCDLVIYDVMFDISSPGYPYGYSCYSDCLFSVRKFNDKICSLVIHFMEFDLQETEGCRGDYLEINESDDRLCKGIKNGTQSKYHSRNICSFIVIPLLLIFSIRCLLLTVIYCFTKQENSSSVLTRFPLDSNLME